MTTASPRNRAFIEIKSNGRRGMGVLYHGSPSISTGLPAAAIASGGRDLARAVARHWDRLLREGERRAAPGRLRARQGQSGSVQAGALLAATGRLPNP